MTHFVDLRYAISTWAGALFILENRKNYPDCVFNPNGPDCFTGGKVACKDMCPHTAIYVSSYRYICVLILLCVCPDTAICVSSYCYVYVLILLYMCPHTAMCVS